MKHQPTHSILGVLFAVALAAPIRAQDFASTFWSAPWMNSASSARIVDIDGDDLLDVAYVVEAPPAVPAMICLVLDQGLGAPPVGLPTPIIAGGSLSPEGKFDWFDFKDFTGDGIVDLLFVPKPTLGSPPSLYLLPGTVAGQFQSTPLLLMTRYFTVEGTADLNDDGIEDLVLQSTPSLNGSPAAIEIQFGGPSSLGVAAYQTVIGSPTFGMVLIGDFDGDGIRDVAFPRTNPNFSAAVLRGFSAASSAGFANPLSTTVNPFVSATSNSLSVGDFDADGRSDILNVGIGQWFAADGFGDFISSFPVAATGSSLLFLPNPRFSKDADLDGADDAWSVNRTIAPRTLSIALGRVVAPNPTMIVGPTVVFSGNAFGGSTLAGDLTASGDLDRDGDPDVLWIERSLFSSGAHVIENRARYGIGCAGAAGIPDISHTTPALGAPVFTIGISGAAPNQLAALLLSFRPAPVAGCGIAVSIAPLDLILPNGQVPLLPTSPTGDAAFFAAIPNLPALAGLILYSQWLVLDAQGTLPISNLLFAATPAIALTFF